jgi:hypothetical protein
MTMDDFGEIRGLDGLDSLQIIAILHKLAKGGCEAPRLSYYPGKDYAHVGQAFQPDWYVLPGWKA